MKNTNPKHTGIAVIESKWAPRSNVSVRGLFELISDIYCGNPNSYHYEMANSRASIEEAIPRIGALKHCKILSINAHGSKDHVNFDNDDNFSREELKICLNAIRGSKFTGLHLGACSLGSYELASYLFQEKVDLKWIARYGKDVSWIDSAAFDFLFFNEMLRKRKGKIPPHKHLMKSAERIKKIAGELARELGFGLYTPNQNKLGAKNLLLPNS